MNRDRAESMAFTMFRRVVSGVLLGPVAAVRASPDIRLSFDIVTMVGGTATHAVTLLAAAEAFSAFLTTKTASAL